MSTSSTNIEAGDQIFRTRPWDVQRVSTRPPDSGRWLLNWQNADDSSLRAVIFKTNTSGDLGEDRVVLAAPGIQAGAESTSALPHDDGATGHEVTVVRLDAQPL